MKPVFSTIVFQFSTQPGFSSWLIRWWTWSDFSHVDIVCHDGSLLGARLDGGVQVRPNEYAKFSNRKRFALCVSNERAARFWEAAWKEIGKPYDWTGIANMALHRDWRETDSWFCSEYAAYCAERGGCPLLNPEVEFRRITPQNALSSVRFTPVSLTTVSSAPITLGAQSRA